MMADFFGSETIVLQIESQGFPGASGEPGATGATGPMGPSGPPGGGVHIGDTPPEDTSLLWIDTTYSSPEEIDGGNAGTEDFDNDIDGGDATSEGDNDLDGGGA